MSKLQIVSAKVKVGGDPLDPVTVAEVEFKSEDGNSFFFSCAEVQGMPSYFKTNESTIDKQTSDETDDEFFDKLNDDYIAGGDYDEVFSDKENPWYPAIRYITYIVRCENEVVDEFIASTVGKCLDEVEVPAIDVEEDLED